MRGEKAKRFLGLRCRASRDDDRGDAWNEKIFYNIETFLDLQPGGRGRNGDIRGS